MLEPGALTTVIDTLWLEHMAYGGHYLCAGLFCLVRPNEGCGCDPAHPRCLIIMALAILTSDQWLPLDANLNIPGYDSFKVSFSSTIDAQAVTLTLALARQRGANCVLFEHARRIAWVKVLPHDPRVATDAELHRYVDTEARHGYQAFFRGG